jgi:hypothetical protein
MSVGIDMARLAGVWMEMLWPLDEGAAVPLCARTVDQSAAYGGRWGIYTTASPLSSVA